MNSSKGCPAELREALNSPIPSLRTPFTSEGAIDFDGLRSQIDFVIAGGARTVMMTWGDSLLSVMTDDEVAGVAKVIVEHTAGRAKVIVADNGWPTNTAVLYGEYCADLGADLLMLLPPDWAGSTTAATVVNHFNAVSEHLPTMLVTAFFKLSGVAGARTPGFEMDVIRALYEEVPGLVAVKDDVVGDLGISLCTTVHERWAVVSGGLKKNHAAQLPYGVDGYLSLFMSYKPEISWNYWKAIQSGDYDASWKITREIERPMFSHMAGVQGGFNAAAHGMFELLGICDRHLPLPYYTMTEGEMEELKAVMENLNLL